MDQKVNLSAKAISNQIKNEVITYGFTWVISTTAVLYAIVMYYMALDVLSSSLENVDTALFGMLMLFTGYMFLCAAKHSKYIVVFWCISSAFISASFVIIAYATQLAWNDPDSAKKILLIGFLVMLMSWNASKIIFLIGAVPIVGFYACLSYLEPSSRSIDIVLSVIKFPMLVVVFYFTVRKLFASAESKFIDNIQTIHRLERDSHLDDLTRIKNRKGFNFNLKLAIDNARRGNSELSVAILDIDFFKQYNDSKGHPAGDLCLKNVAAILGSECKRAIDTVARIGGEEFALIMPSTSEENALIVAKKIQAALERAVIKHPTSSISEYVTVSIGITEFSSGDDFNSLYERADKAMYKAKVAGRNRVVVCHRDCSSCRKQKKREITA